MAGNRTCEVMEINHEILLSLVRCSLWGTEPVYEHKPDWDRILSLADQQTLTGLVAEAVPRLPKEYQPEASQRLKLQSRVMKIYQSHALLNRKVAQTKQLMDAHGIHSVLFKGQGMALNYPNPLSRQCGDIDLYVGDRHFLDAMNILEPDETHDPSKYTHLKHFNTNSEGVEIEIHRIAEIIPGTARNRRFLNWTVSRLEGSDVRKEQIGGTEVNLPPVDFDAVYIMNHAWHHFMTGGIGLRQLCDWSIYLHRFHKQIDRDLLKENLKSFGLERAWQIFAGVAVRYLGLPAEECPLYTGAYDGKAAEVMEVIWSEGNFGKHSDYRKTPRPEGHFAGKLHSFKLNTSRIIRILSISPADVTYSWIYYFINGMRNVFVRLK